MQEAISRKSRQVGARAAALTAAAILLAAPVLAQTQEAALDLDSSILQESLTTELVNACDAGVPENDMVTLLSQLVAPFDVGVVQTALQGATVAEGLCPAAVAALGRATSAANVVNQQTALAPGATGEGEAPPDSGQLAPFLFQSLQNLAPLGGPGGSSYP
jgi:hypothetical protein